MKRLLTRLLEMLGLVTVGRYRSLAAKLREAEARAKKLTTLLEETRAESKDWRAKATEALKQSQIVSKDASHQAQRVEKLKTEGDGLREQIVRARASHEEQLVRARASREELETLQTRLAEAERELAVAREHLMAIEVKLDILEGAANVLDARTRSVIAQRAGKTGVAV